MGSRDKENRHCRHRGHRCELGRADLARGLKVTATDAGPQRGRKPAPLYRRCWTICRSSASRGASRDNLRFRSISRKALRMPTLSRENGPERKDFKIKLFADMDRRDAAGFDHRLEFPPVSR